MTPEQFEILCKILREGVDKLEEIRCGIIDVENELIALKEIVISK